MCLFRGLLPHSADSAFAASKGDTAPHLSAAVVGAVARVAAGDAAVADVSVADESGVGDPLAAVAVHSALGASRLAVTRTFADLWEMIFYDLTSMFPFTRRSTIPNPPDVSDRQLNSGEVGKTQFQPKAG